MTAAASLLIVHHQRAAEISIGVGFVLLVWIVVQVLIIPFSWLQPAFFAGGLVVIALGWRLRNHAPSYRPLCARSMRNDRVQAARAPTGHRAS
jgi:hypothetical protein